MLIYNIINKLTICLLLKIPEKGIYYTVDNRDMVLQTRGGQLEQINQNSSLYVVLYYVLLFYKNENGWHPIIPIYGTQLGKQEKNKR